MGTIFHGALVSFSEKGTQLRAPHSLELLNNLKLKLLIEAEHIYAKVIQQSNVDEDLFLLRFTSVTPKAMAILNALRQPG